MLDDADMLAKGLEMGPQQTVDGIFKAIPVHLDNNLSEDSDVIGIFHVHASKYVLYFKEIVQKV